MDSSLTFLMAPAFAFVLLAAAGAAPLLLSAVCSALCSASVTAAALTDMWTSFPAWRQAIFCVGQLKL